MNSLSRTQKPRAGFTLLEVMVVIVILGRPGKSGGA